jgi:hypothetical protein
MYRRLIAAVSLAVVLSMAVPAFAAPRRDPNSNIIDRIILKLKRVFHPFDLNDVSPPKP